MVKYLKLAKKPNKSIKNGLLIFFEEEDDLMNFEHQDILKGKLRYKLPSDKVTEIYRRIK